MPATSRSPTRCTRRAYGRLNDAVREAVARAARHEAPLLDPVYTGKAMAGLVSHVRAGRIAAGSRVLSSTPADCRRSSPTPTSSAPGSWKCLGRRRADDALGAGSRTARYAVGCGPRLFEDPLAECLDLGPLPGSGRGDEAAAFGRFGLEVEDPDQRPALQLARDAPDGGAEAVHGGLDHSMLYRRKPGARDRSGMDSP